MALYKLVNGRRVEMTREEEAAFVASQEPVRPRQPAKDRLEAVVETLIARGVVAGAVAAELREKARGK